MAQVVVLESSIKSNKGYFIKVLSYRVEYFGFRICKQERYGLVFIEKDPSSLNDTKKIIAVLAAVLSVSTFSIVINSAKVQAQEGQTFSASLSGKDEVPPTESNSTGTAKFQVDENSSQVSYWVNVTG